MKEKITMQSSSFISIHDCFEMYIKKCTVRNLSEKTICVYRKHNKILAEFVDAYLSASTIINDILDDFTLYVKESHDCTDISINSLLSCIRALSNHFLAAGKRISSTLVLRIYDIDFKIRIHLKTC